MAKEFEQKRSWYFQHLTNLSEILLFFAIGIGSAFIPFYDTELLWIVAVGYLLVIAYFIVTSVPLKVFWLRVGGMVIGLVLGAKELMVIYPIHSALALLLLGALVFGIHLAYCKITLQED